MGSPLICLSLAKRHLLKNTIGVILDENQGFGPGFDFARIALAFGVLWWHSVEVTQGSMDAYDLRPLWIADYSIVPMFFALSGFLVAASAQRLSLGQFYVNRGLRILPALIVEVGLSAFLLGTIFTTLPLSEYFTSPRFWSYLTNIVGRVQLDLPGVFDHQPHLDSGRGVVNGSLWTVPLEMNCYLLMFVVIAFGLMRRPVLLACLALGILLAINIPNYIPHLPDDGTSLRAFDRLPMADKRPLLVPAFVVGLIFYSMRYSIPYSRVLFGGCIAALLVIGCIFEPTVWDNSLSIVCTAPILTYVIIFVGLSDIPAVPFFHRGDYSYGVYLYGYPIQQSVKAIFPGMASVGLHFVASAVLVTLFAAFSWHVIERPILSLRKTFSFVKREQKVAG